MTVVGRAAAPALRHRVEPEDVLQQAYVAAFESFQSCDFPTPAAFFAWLKTIALSRLRDAERKWRTAKRDAQRLLAAPDGMTETYPGLLSRVLAPDSTPSVRVSREEAIAAVMSSLARLTTDQREVVTRRFLHGQAVADVAKGLGKTEAAVHMLCHRGLTALRGHLTTLTRAIQRAY